MLSIRNTPRRLSDPSSSHLKNNACLGLRAVSPAYNWIVWNRKNFECSVFGKVSKKLRLEIFYRAILNCGTQKSFFWDEIPGREFLTVFEFFWTAKSLVPPWPARSKIWKITFCMPCGRVIPSRRVAPRLQKSAGLPLIWRLLSHNGHVSSWDWFRKCRCWIVWFELVHWDVLAEKDWNRVQNNAQKRFTGGGW